MPKIIQLSPHIANLIAAGEVVERPASVVKELLENAIDAGATQITVEIRDGGMTYLRVTDNGCGMAPDDARTAFLRHATSKLRSAEDLAAITTMGFRGEALAAIASVSRIDLLTKSKDAFVGTNLHLEAGKITEEGEAGCPDGTTIIVRDLFFNTPARMKFMKADSVEGSRVSAAVQMQALAHPGTAVKLLRDGKQVLSTPGTGSVQDVLYCVYGRDFADMITVDSSWDQCRISGYVSKPSAARPSRNLQTFFVNNRPVRSRLLISALEEAYRNQLMVGKFPACVLHLELSPSAVDVNVHPAKTEIKFLNEKGVFDCVHYGVLAALNRTPDRPAILFSGNPQSVKPVVTEPLCTNPPVSSPTKSSISSVPGKKADYFRTMSSEEYRSLSDTLKKAPQIPPDAAIRTVTAMSESVHHADIESIPKSNAPQNTLHEMTKTPSDIRITTESNTAKVSASLQARNPEPRIPDAPEIGCQQEELNLPPVSSWRMIGELYHTYILVEQGEDAFLIDKHAAHERILFDKLKANQEEITPQTLLTPLTVRLDSASCGELLANQPLLDQLGFVIEEFGENTILLRQIPMDLKLDQASDTLIALASDLLTGRAADPSNTRDEMLHTVACKAAIKAGWINDEKELLAIVQEVMRRDDLKYCPHGRPICISLSKTQIEKQFRRT